MMLSIILCAAFFSRATAQDVFVSNDFTADQCTTAERNCPDIVSALNISTSFSTVYLYAGVYSGTGNANICIGKCVGLKGVTLAGMGDPAEVVLASRDVPFADTVAMYIYENTIIHIANMTIQDYSNTVSTEPNKAGAMEVVNSNILFENVVFRNNSGVIGGAVHVTNSNVTLNDTSFLENSARLHGGALYFINSNVEVNHCLFRHNNVSTIPANAAGTGGAIYFIGVNDLAIFHTDFIGNTAMRSGGALFMQLNSNTGIKSLAGQFSAKNSLFRDNSVKGQGNCVYSGTCNSRGGALFINALSTQLVDCVFDGNSALTTSTTEVTSLSLVVYLCSVLCLYFLPSSPLLSSVLLCFILVWRCPLLSPSLTHHSSVFPSPLFLSTPYFKNNSTQLSHHTLHTPHRQLKEEDCTPPPTPSTLSPPMWAHTCTTVPSTTTTPQGRAVACLSRGSAWIL